MIEYYHGYKITAQRGHVIVADADGDFFESADDLQEAIADIDAEITLDDLRETVPVVKVPSYYNR